MPTPCCRMNRSLGHPSGPAETRAAVRKPTEDRPHGLAVSSGRLRRVLCYGLLLALLAVRSIAAAPGGAATNRLRDTLQFSNGDRFSGVLQGISADGWVSWNHADLEKPALLSTRNLTQLDLDGRGGDATAGATWKVRFENDDELSVGRLQANATDFELETWYLGKVKVPRSRVRSISPVQTNFMTLFEGPTGTNGWTSWKVVVALGEPGEWKYQNGAFYAKEAASIARPLNLPDSFTMEFDIRWKGPLNMAIALFTDSLKPISLANKEDEPDFAGFYSLQINSYGANLLSVRKRDPLRYLGQQAIPGISTKSKAHVEIKADKRSRRILLFIDGMLVKQWVEPTEFSGEGKGIRLVHQGQGSVRFSGLKVTEWDGRYEDRMPAAAGPQTEDVVLMLDGERITGRIRSIDASNLIIADVTGEKTKPVQQIRAIEFHPAAAPTNKTTPTAKAPASGSVAGAESRAFFQKHGRLTLDLEQVDGGKVRVNAPMIGRVDVDIAAVSRLTLVPK